MFFVELKSLLHFLSVQTKSGSSNNSYFAELEKNTWHVIKESIVTLKENKPNFKHNNQFFFEQLNDFVRCFTMEIKDEIDTPDYGLMENFNGHFYGLVEVIASSYLNLLSSNKTKSVQEYFIKIIMLALCKPLLLHILTQQCGDGGAPARDSKKLTIVIAFVNKTILPLLSEEENGVHISALSSMPRILNGEDKSNYLNYLFQVSFLSREFSCFFLSSPFLMFVQSQFILHLYSIIF